MKHLKTYKENNNEIIFIGVKCEFSDIETFYKLGYEFQNLYMKNEKRFNQYGKYI